MKQGVKRLLVLALIAIGAIACFTASNWLPKINMGNIFATSQTNKDTAIHVEGLEYKDGWNLISDAEDYYVMCEIGRAGSLPGVKFKLTNDITIDPVLGNMDVCKGIILDGDGYGIHHQYNPDYEEDVLMRYDYTDPENGGKWGGSGSYVIQSVDGWTTYAEYVRGYSIYSTYHCENGVTFNGIKTIKTTTLIDFPNSSIPDQEISVDNKFCRNVFAYGGLVGIAEYCTFENIYLKQQSSLTITHDYNKVGRIVLGGIVGIARQCTFNNCVVRNYSKSWKIVNSNGTILDSTNTTTGSLNMVSALNGYLVGHSLGSTKFNNCLYVYDDTNDIINNFVDGLFVDKGSSDSFANCYSISSQAAKGSIKNSKGFSGNVATGWSEYDSKDWIIISEKNNGEIIQTANVTKPKYTITADANGGTLSSSWSKEIEPGSSIGTLPEDPTRSGGYDFIGWFTAKEGGTNLGFNGLSSTYIPTGDMTIYARWRKYYEIRAYANGGVYSSEGDWEKSSYIVDISQVEYLYKYIYVYSTATLTSLPPTPTPVAGYRFKNWNTEQDGSGDTVRYSYNLEDSSYVENELRLSIYAQYEIVRVTFPEYPENDEYRPDPPRIEDGNLVVPLPPPPDGHENEEVIIGENSYPVEGDEIKVPLEGVGNNNIVIEKIETRPLDYTITLILDTEEINPGKIENYLATGAISYSNNTITYNYESEFYLPNAEQTQKEGYTFTGWEITDLKKGETDINEPTIWGDISTILPLGNNGEGYYVAKQHYGNVELTARWSENKYTIKIYNHEDDVATPIATYEDVLYTEERPIQETATRAADSKYTNGYVFVGWSTSKFADIADEHKYNVEDKIFTYLYVYESLDNNNDIATLITNGTIVTQLTAEDGGLVEIYGQWLPIYTLTINLGTNYSGDGRTGIYKGNTKQSYRSVDIETDYFRSLPLYDMEDTDVFNTPADKTSQDSRYNFALMYYGHIITDWEITVGNDTYMVNVGADNKLMPQIEDWDKVPSDFVGRPYVKSKTNMQYLQGNIIANPNWEAIKFDVIFMTGGAEDYASQSVSDYLSQQGRVLSTACITEDVVFGEPYVIRQAKTGILSLDANQKIVQAVNIYGYSVIYARPYDYDNNLDLDSDKIISLDGNGEYTQNDITGKGFGTWEYILDYKKYEEEGKTDKWYIKVEGYYLPDLYKIKLDLQLPYTENNNFEADYNGFALATDLVGNLTYTKYSFNANDGYYLNNEYTSKQGKVYVDNGEYYIYLLQDQIIQDGVIKNKYKEDGTSYSQDEINADNGRNLPTFEIDYYDMQYYYTLDSSVSSINMYQLSPSLDTYYVTKAETTLESIRKIQTDEIGPEASSTASSWGYSCAKKDSDVYTEETIRVEINPYQKEGYYTPYALNVYWYRNIVNLDILNLIKQNVEDTAETPLDTFNGYVIITEEERVAETLLDHLKYNLVIYENGQLVGYIIYEFNDITELNKYISGKYTYNEFKSNSGITSKAKELIPIYFGNTFKIEAVDQRNDYSALRGDTRFVGYRFDRYELEIDADNVNEISEFETAESKYVEYRSNNNSYDTYVVQTDLKNYEKDNSTNYFNDRDTITIKSIFTPIRYQYTYQVTDSNYVPNSDYGSIGLVYGTDTKYGSIIENYEVTIDENISLTSRMQVRLGTEFLSWDLIAKFKEQGQLYSSRYTESQTINMLVNARHLIDMHYIDAFPTNPIQFVGYMNAVCQDIEFEIRVNLIDISTDEVLKNYTLTDDTPNPIFTIEGNKVSIDKSYKLVMTPTKKDGDISIYYEIDNKKYVIKGLYLAPSLSSSTKQLETTFSYPITSFEDIPMNVTHNLLESSVNYIQYVSVTDKYLVFNVELAPTFELSFKAVTNNTDKQKDQRRVYVNETLVASAEDTEKLLASTKKYLAYWGQETVISFTGNPNYYQGAKTTINYENAPSERYEIQTNSNTVYTVKGEAEIVIELQPRTYIFNMYITYNGNRYYEVDGEFPLSEIKNASGSEQILNDVTKETTSQTGILYYGDIVRVRYEMNSRVSNDYEVRLKSNGKNVLPNINGEYVFEFLGTNITVELEIKAITETVKIETNLNSHNVGEIKVQVNNGQAEQLNQVSGKELELVNGDKVRIYIQEGVGYEFANEYQHAGKQEEVTPEIIGGYKSFELLEEGFDLSKKGYYYLWFRQVPIRVNFKYVQVVPSLEEVEVEEEYVSISESGLIEKGSEVTLIQGKDKVGYRFNGYTYEGPQGEGKVLGGTEVEGSYTFTITEEIMEHLGNVGKNSEGELVLEIYVNYVKQYIYEVVYGSDSRYINVEVKDESGQEVKKGEYWDYGTEIKIKVSSKDTEHRKIEMKINGIEVEETAKLEKEYTNLGNVSGYTKQEILTENKSIWVRSEVEKYDTILKESLVTGEGEQSPQSLTLMGKEGIFHLTKNIYYEVEGSHEYGSEVVVRVYVTEAVEESEQYYGINEAKLNGERLSILELGESEEVPGSVEYEIRYILRDGMPTEQTLELSFNALYLVKVG